METKCCGTCKWHECEMDDSWICFNSDSEYCADWTDYGHCCEKWEERTDMKPIDNPKGAAAKAWNRRE